MPSSSQKQETDFLTNINSFNFINDRQDPKDSNNHELWGMTKIGPLKKNSELQSIKIFLLKSLIALTIAQDSLKPISSLSFL